MSVSNFCCPVAGKPLARLVMSVFLQRHPGEQEEDMVTSLQRELARVREEGEHDVVLHCMEGGEVTAHRSDGLSQLRK